jgi:hypothetical protein
MFIALSPQRTQRTQGEGLQVIFVVFDVIVV